MGGDLFFRPRQHPAPPPERTFFGRPDDDILRAIRSRRIIGARATAGSSLSMFLNLDGPDDAAFKPATDRGQRWYGEIAAYRLGRLLGIDRIPPAATRDVRIPVVRSLLKTNVPVLERFNEEALFNGDNTVGGAVMYWIPSIHGADVDRLENLEQWTRWLQQGGAIPPEQLSLAQQLSDTIVFDYVTGNWDRWSGGNVLFGPDETTLLIMDNNAAFNVEFSERLRERLDAPLNQVERYSASMYRRLLGLSEADYRAELAQDSRGDQLLTDEQMDAIFVRRDEVVERIEALTHEHGHDEVLCFP
jgi:hypothetical protein